MTRNWPERHTMFHRPGFRRVHKNCAWAATLLYTLDAHYSVMVHNHSEQFFSSNFTSSILTWQQLLCGLAFRHRLHYIARPLYGSLFCLIPLADKYDVQRVNRTCQLRVFFFEKCFYFEKSPGFVHGGMATLSVSFTCTVNCASHLKCN